jgi:hypothetical protein
MTGGWDRVRLTFCSDSENDILDIGWLEAMDVSGVAEGACRHLVKDRMERTGMRWRLPSAQAMLDLRASDQWENFQSYRIDAEGK